MYDDFSATDRWTKQPIHCIYQALVAAIATRHADAIDIKFMAGGRPVWIALPHSAWAKYHTLTGKVITDSLAVQTAGHYLRSAIETGLDNGREMYALSENETLQHVSAVLREFNAPQDAIPNLEPAPA